MRVAHRARRHRAHLWRGALLVEQLRASYAAAPRRLRPSGALLSRLLEALVRSGSAAKWQEGRAPLRKLLLLKLLLLDDRGLLITSTARHPPGQEDRPAACRASRCGISW